MKNYKLLLFIALLISCSDESSILYNKIDIDIIDLDKNNNVLSFNNSKNIFEYVNYKSNPKFNFSTDMRESTFNFVSFRDVYLKALEELDLAKTLEEHNDILDKYSDIITITDDSYVPTISRLTFQLICNRKGLYGSKNYIHRVIDDKFVVMGEKQYINEIIQINSIDEIDLNKFSLVNFVGQNLKSNSNSRVENHCGIFDANGGNFINKYVDNSASNCKDKRRATGHMHAFFTPMSTIQGVNYTPTVEVSVLGLRQKWLNCKWQNYNTALEARAGNFTVEVTINGNSNIYTGSWGYYYSALDEEKAVLFSNAVGPSVTLSGSKTIYFNGGNTNLEISSRGVGDNWAIINCH